MAVAGKVAITLSTENGGAWSADVTYDRLVAVKHNNNLYISRKTVANVEPPNDEFWFLALEGFGGDDVQTLIDRMNELSDLIQTIINGTTQVGNAKTLDGYDAEYFAKETDLANYLPLDNSKAMSGSLRIITDKAEQRYLRVQNANRRIDLIVNAGGTVQLRDETNSQNIIDSQLDGKNTFNGTASGNIAKTDKPTGTYTGNGSAEQRTIATGGKGLACLINGNGYGFLATYSGGICFGRDGITHIPGLKFQSGSIIIETDALVNVSGKGYDYDVI